MTTNYLPGDATGTAKTETEVRHASCARESGRVIGPEGLNTNNHPNHFDGLNHGTRPPTICVEYKNDLGGTMSRPLSSAAPHSRRGKTTTGYPRRGEASSSAREPQCLVEEPCATCFGIHDDPPCPGIDRAPASIARTAHSGRGA